jgi:hypothetical protein
MRGLAVLEQRGRVGLLLRAVQLEMVEPVMLEASLQQRSKLV